MDRAAPIVDPPHPLAEVSVIFQWSDDCRLKAALRLLRSDGVRDPLVVACVRRSSRLARCGSVNVQTGLVVGATAAVPDKLSQ